MLLQLLGHIEFYLLYSQVFFAFTFFFFYFSIESSFITKGLINIHLYYPLYVMELFFLINQKMHSAPTCNKNSTYNCLTLNGGLFSSGNEIFRAGLVDLYLQESKLTPHFCSLIRNM